MTTLIPKHLIDEHNKEVENLIRKLDSLRGTWIERSPFMRELVIWYLERKFLKSIKRIKRGI